MSRMMQMIIESINDIGLFKAIFVAGPPGAGKTTLLKKITSGRISPRVLNVDKHIERMITVPGFYYGHEYYEKAREISDREMYNYVNGLLPLYIDGTASSIEKTNRRNNILRNIGYDTGMIFIVVDKDKLIQRLIKRNERSNRQVRIEDTDKIYNEIMKNRQYYKPLFDFYVEVDVDDDSADIDKIYNKVDAFFRSKPVNNIGKLIIDRMKSRNIKYLVPDIYSEQKLKSMIKGFH